MSDESVLGIKSEALRLLTGLENGNLELTEAYRISENLDPVLIYFIVRYLRESYGPSNPHSKGVTDRMLELSSTYPKFVAATKKGEADILREWFDDSYSIRDFWNKQDEFIGMIVDKLEG